MKEVTLTVNGERLSARVEARTQLAELIRDHFALTGTHLGCEQGVCGACTVVLNGQPVRSCIAYAHACDGAEVITIEGLSSDDLAGELRDAFCEHHALQCGFCTPGMLITARDLLHRCGDLTEQRIRTELSGNLCRCTGYVGIVDAVAAVARARGTWLDEAPAAGARREVTTAVPLEEAPFSAFQLREDDRATTPAALAGPTGSASRTTPAGFSAIDRTLKLNAAPGAVQALLGDLERACGCIPGVELREHGDERFEGTASIHFGPIAARFAGAGHRELHEGGRRATLHATARDRDGQSNLAVRFEYAVADDAEQAELTQLTLRMHYRLEGRLAQFNRPELVQSFADALLQRFASNCERAIAGETPITDEKLGGFSLIWQAIKARLSG